MGKGGPASLDPPSTWRLLEDVLERVCVNMIILASFGRPLVYLYPGG